MFDLVMMQLRTVGERGRTGPEAGLLGGTNVTTVFRARDDCDGRLWTVKRH